ncbi:hypothetical protein SK128_001356 [Halocaridina rubra]|uniref:Uncharacterized protein n=1 Tax=Halocaridina rubra TaxID=373956 RepID=A0AAN9AAH3_HALRR
MPQEDGTGSSTAQELSDVVKSALSTNVSDYRGSSSAQELSDISAKALSTNVFGFETILTGLVYLSFGIFLYQMIQRAVEAKTLRSSFPQVQGKNHRKREVYEDQLNQHFAVLQQALQKTDRLLRNIKIIKNNS